MPFSRQLPWAAQLPGHVGLHGCIETIGGLGMMAMETSGCFFHFLFLSLLSTVQGTCILLQLTWHQAGAIQPIISAQPSPGKDLAQLYWDHRASLQMPCPPSCLSPLPSLRRGWRALPCQEHLAVFFQCWFTARLR